jgi:hypothetical protein
VRGQRRELPKHSLLAILMLLCGLSDHTLPFLPLAMALSSVSHQRGECPHYSNLELGLWLYFDQRNTVEWQRPDVSPGFWGTWVLPVVSPASSMALTVAKSSRPTEKSPAGPGDTAKPNNGKESRHC